jgi:hypothetical protein
MDERKVDPGEGLSICARPVFGVEVGVDVGVGVGVELGLGLGDGDAVGVGDGDAVGLGVGVVTGVVTETSFEGELSVAVGL